MAADEALVDAVVNALYRRGPEEHRAGEAFAFVLDLHHPLARAIATKLGKSGESGELVVSWVPFAALPELVNMLTHIFPDGRTAFAGLARAPRDRSKIAIVVVCDRVEWGHADVPAPSN